jgi:methionyl-tRNA formyltransferase
MDRGVDTGPILIKRCITPVPGSTFASIRAELETVMVKMMLKGVEGIANDSLRTCNQTADDGQQYFVMHPRMKQAAEKKLRKILLP